MLSYKFCAISGTLVLETLLKLVKRQTAVAGEGYFFVEQQQKTTGIRSIVLTRRSVHHLHAVVPIIFSWSGQGPVTCLLKIFFNRKYLRAPQYSFNPDESVSIYNYILLTHEDSDAYTTGQYHWIKYCYRFGARNQCFNDYNTVLRSTQSPAKSPNICLESEIYTYSIIILVHIHDPPGSPKLVDIGIGVSIFVG